MLKKKALRKILITSMTVLILLAIYLIPGNTKTISKNNQVKIMYEVEKRVVYYLNKDDLLVRTTIALEKTTDIEAIKLLIEDLIISNNVIIPDGLFRFIPKGTDILDVKIEEDLVIINLSKDILKSKDIIKSVEGIIYTVFDNFDYCRIKILVDDILLKDKVEIYLPEAFTKDFGINKKYDIKSRNNINKYVVYYVDKIGNHNYYVPITKYVNSDNEKIKIIIEDLSSNYIYEPNLVSYLNNKTELINYEIDEDTMILNFNNSIFMYDNVILEEVIYTISYSMFDNYDVGAVVFNVNSEEITKKVLKDIE